MRIEATSQLAAFDPVTFLNGLLDDLRLYGRPLTAPEIRDLYDSATAR